MNPRARVAVLLWIAVACHDSSAPPESAGSVPAGSVPARTASTSAPEPFEPTRTGALLGRVRVEGDLPRPSAVAAELPAGCVHADAPGPDDPASAAVHGVDGGLGGACVAVVEGWRRWAFPPTTPRPVVLEQRGCRFRPRLLALRVGQTLSVTNRDPVTHNVHTFARRNPGRNFVQRALGADLELVFERAEIVPVGCDLHPWMKAFVAVFEHPLFACTAPDGSFRIDGVPPGSYTLEVWHEVLGALRASARVAAGEECRVEFVYPSQP